MASAARRFRIEMTQEQGGRGGDGGGTGGAGGGSDGDKFREIMDALADIRASIGNTEQMVSQEIVEDYRGRADEARQLRIEMESVQHAINTTKLELAALHAGPGGRDIHSVTDQLDAVVKGTEQATEQLLQAAEHIDNDANDLSARLKDGESIDLLDDIRDQTVKIFEACNFQDLTGQRITKVVNTLRFIEERVDTMMALWSDLEAFVLPQSTRDEGTIMHGPALEDDSGVASQDDIDALFD
ncbi:protein phosphatase CheZ [Microbaculum marinisediminis]|uniref:Protein phosphatase CheZ n=1 Tax=Microbaculum marinisediminis TaxID=2931392 RepID=A0AAW5QT84_9HYPH|nr:protein phosphatase CheZ [Microbaculum sp. A6E488]MCT8970417.1 protein phosphatase CheZ [Microbaculum sp. A6E488]